MRQEATESIPATGDLQPEVRARFDDISDDLDGLCKLGYLSPGSVGSALDVGTGSGMGALALRQILPDAVIDTIDDGSSYQTSPDYRLRPVPASAARFIRSSLADWTDRSASGYDLVMAVQFPFFPNNVSDWKENCTGAAANLLDMARLLNQGGTLAIGYKVGKEIVTINQIRDIFRWDRLFSDMQDVFDGRFRHFWLILSNPYKVALRKAIGNPAAYLPRAAWHRCRLPTSPIILCNAKLTPADRSQV
ncbi:hypothetical protein A2Z33_04220 [Candidatus Gottesmanbacteria bacterium RBG_16_52_11]|uniref:Uncharacterized protein n=1 Tax=Candidatus Gottesmanbacteria bacterium RBG_16_52_11 TaxID=1798374 RepID=A0A1F5YW26_9BACT|nr:MAG: hypothetical protein A2Z33_04220 [Candidatus Gottesmanbacteria bacterium RBG_16_52_11]